MTDPAKQDIGWPAIFWVNARMALAVIVLFYGWIVWQMASIDFWGFYLLGPMCFFAGGLFAVSALWKAKTLIVNQLHWKRFERLGSKPRADSMASDDAFTRGGPGQ